MKRNISALLMLALLASLAACGGEGASADTTAADTAGTSAPEAAEPTPLEAMGKKDFGGAVYTIVDGNDYQDTYQNLPGDTQNGDIVNDGLYDRGRYMEDNYNVTIEYRVMSKKDAADQTRQSVMAGEKNCDLLLSGIAGGGLETMATSGLLMNLASFDELSLDSAWWSSLMNEQVRLGDRIFMTSGDIVPTMYGTLTCVFLNNKLLADYKLEQDYYTLVTDGKWTWDVLKGMTASFSRDLNGDDQMMAADDFFGLLYMKNSVATGAVITGSGVQLSTIDKDTVRLNLATERMTSVMDKLSGVLLPLRYADQNDCLYAFKADRAIALIHSTATGKNWFRDMDSDFMILPIPKYDEAQAVYYSYSNPFSPGYVGIPLTATDESTGFITEALARYSYEFIRPKLYDLVLKQKASRDEGSGEMLDIIFDSAYLDFNSIYNFGGTRTALQSVLFDGAELASSIASAQSAADAAIAEFMKSWLK